MFSLFKKDPAVQAQLLQQQDKIDTLTAQLAAIEASSAIIEFTPSGEIISANDIFLSLMGYQLNELKGKHHRIFCDQAYSQTSEYKALWQNLSQGKPVSGQFQRFTKSGQHVWLEASYNPIRDKSGKVIKVIKLASDTTQKTNLASSQGHTIAALNHSMAVIEFETDSTIIKANQNFLAATGYSKDEIIGKKHQMFCSREFAQSKEYSAMWQKLRQGQFIVGQFPRVNKQGQMLWLEASYNPIINEQGKVVKVIKFASDITARIEQIQTTQQQVSDASASADQTCKQGSAIASEAAENMRKLSSDMAKASKSMTELNKQSDEINNIVSTISAIAEQTNLLALNAAIEAARAGDQGRGFAVVADEVRGLAARTSESTSEIAQVVQRNLTLCDEACEFIEHGSQQVQQGAQLIDQLNESLTKLNTNLSTIVSAVEQS